MNGADCAPINCYRLVYTYDASTSAIKRDRLRIFLALVLASARFTRDLCLVCLRRTCKPALSVAEGAPSQTHLVVGGDLVGVVRLRPDRAGCCVRRLQAPEQQPRLVSVDARHTEHQVEAVLGVVDVSDEVTLTHLVLLQCLLKFDNTGLQDEASC